MDHESIMKNKITGGVLATIGYLLSPFSWWNDPIVNIPLAYGFAYLFSLISKSLFLPMMLIGYWLTNVAGFILMHKGIKNIKYAGKDGCTKKELIKDIVISIFYTLIVITLIKMGWLKFPTEYFK